MSAPRQRQPRARRNVATTETTTTETEAAFQAAVVELARHAGWATYHTHDSRRSDPGFPDLTLVKNGRLLMVELKSARGRLRPAQRNWLAMLSYCGVEVALWRPQYWPNIVAALVHGERIPQPDVTAL